MAVGKQVGRLSIRVLPDSSKFNADLKTMVERAEQKYKIRLNVEAVTREAELTLARFRTVESQRRIEIGVQANTAAASEAVAVVARDRSLSIQVNTDVGATRETLAMLARPRSTTINVSAAVAVARAQMAVAARDRFVDFNVRLKESSLAKANAGIARLSGFRIAKQIFSDVTEALTNMDINVPKISRIATAIGTLSSLVLSGSAGIVTLSGDLLKMGNAGLVLPAMLAGAATGIITLALALKDSKEQLATLGPAMNELQDIISSSFWAKAKQPIIDFVESVLPQAREGFALTATALGNQAAAIASAFQKTFGNGVLEGMFQKLAETMDIVTTGATGFAESMTTLGVVGSAYLPRLASWIVSIGDAFNVWVQRVAASGELNGYINDGIEQMKLFGSSIADIVRIFKGIDKAATAAGGGGLTTFAAKMKGAAEAVNSEAFQTALTTILVGANLAIDGLGKGFSAFGTTIGALAPQIGLVLSIAGETLGGLMESIAKAMDQPAFSDGLVNFFTGIQAGAEALQPAMEPLFALLGQLGTTFGVLAETVATVMAAIKIEFAPVMESILKAVTPLIPVLGGLLVGAIQALGPVVSFLATALAPLIGPFILLAGVVKGVQFAIMVAGWIQVTAAMVAHRIVLLQVLASYAKDFIVAAAKVVTGLALQTAAWVKNTAVMVASRVATLAGAVAMGVGAVAMRVFNTAMAANPILIVVTAIAALVAGLIWFFTQTELGQAIWANFTTFLGEAWTNIQSVATTVFTALGQFFTDTWNNIVSFVTFAITTVSAVITGVTAAISATWIAVWTAIGTFFSTVWNGLVAFVTFAITTVSAVITGVTAAISATWTAVWTGISSFFSAIWNGIVAFVTAYIAAVQTVLSAVVTAISAAWTAAWNGISAFFSAIWTGIVAFVTAYINTVQTIIRTVVTAISTAWTTSWNAIKAFFSAVWTGIVAFVTAYINTVQSIIRAVVAAISSTWNTMWSNISSFFSTIWNGIVAFVKFYINLVQSVIRAVVATISATWSAVWNNISSFFSGVWNGIVSFVKFAINTVQSIIAAVVAAISATWSAVWNGISSFFSGLWNGIISFVGSAIGTVLSVVSSVGAAISGVWNGIWSGIQSVVSGAWGFITGMVSNIVNGISGMIGTIGETLAGIPGKVGEAFSGAGQWLMDAGKSIIQGLIDGINNMIGAAKRAAGAVMDAVSNFFPHSPAPEGPFSGRGWTLYSGQALGDGVIDGMESRISRVRKAALQMMNAASEGTVLTGVDAGLTGLNAMQSREGDRIVIEGDVGYDPKKIIEELDIKKWQAQQMSGIKRMAVA